MTGCRCSPARSATRLLAVPAFWLIFIGFNITFFLMHLTGLLGMPAGLRGSLGRRLDLAEPAVVGGRLRHAIGFGRPLIDLLVQLRYSRRSRRDPWKATTLEWAMASLPPAYNFASIAPIDTHGADRMSPGSLAPVLARGEGYLGFTRHGWQETLAGDMTSASKTRPSCCRRPRPAAVHRVDLRHRHRGAGLPVQDLRSARSREPRRRRCSSMARWAPG